MNINLNKYSKSYFSTYLKYSWNRRLNTSIICVTKKLVISFSSIFFLKVNQNLTAYREIGRPSFKAIRSLL